MIAVLVIHVLGKTMASAFDLIVDQLADPQAQWSLGTFGAIAEFMRDPDEPADISQDETSMAVVTPRGGLPLLARANLPPGAVETITTQGWSPRVPLCPPPPEAAMERRALPSPLCSHTDGPCA